MWCENRSKNSIQSSSKVNTYYCNEQEYNEIISARQMKDDTYECINKIFGYVVTNTAIFKEINALVKNYNYSLILSYLQENFDYLYEVMHRDFEKEYGKIRYFSAILNNNLRDYKKEKEEEYTPVKQVEVDIINGRRNVEDLMKLNKEGD